MREAVQGPNCADPLICRGDCCSIKIDVPRGLSEEYIRRGFAKEEDFVRSNVFSFQLRFDNVKTKCFLFNKDINGCSIHFSGIKPPQCWIYPTGFTQVDGEEKKCKRAGGWKIIEKKKAQEASKLLEEYKNICKDEARDEIEGITKRINEKKIITVLKKVAPSRLGGFRDTWNEIQPLSAEGLSLQMNKFCRKYNKDCKVLENNFLECNSVCELIARQLVKILKKELITFIKENGSDVEGKYPLYKLFKKSF